MSRSRRKTAGFCHTDTVRKKMFNRSLRRKANMAVLLEDEGDWEIIDGDLEYLHYEQYMSYEVGNGSEYRKHNCRWDIRDWNWVMYDGKKEWDEDFYWPFYKYLMK